MDTSLINPNWISYADKAASTSAAGDTGYFGTAFTVIMSLCFILGIIFLIVGAVKKYGGKYYLDKFLGTQKDQSLKVVNKLMLGGKKYLYVVSWNNQEYLLGVTENSINPISRSDENFSMELEKCEKDENE